MQVNANGLHDAMSSATTPRHSEGLAAPAVACLSGVFVFGLVALGSFASGNGPASVCLGAVAMLLLCVFVQVWSEEGPPSARRFTARRTLNLALFLHVPMLSVLMMCCALVGWVPPSLIPGWFFLTYAMFLTPVVAAMVASVAERHQ